MNTIDWFLVIIFMSLLSVLLGLVTITESSYAENPTAAKRWFYLSAVLCMWGPAVLTILYFTK